MPKRISGKWLGGIIRNGIYWVDRDNHRVRFSTKQKTQTGAERVLADYESDPEGFLRRERQGGTSLSAVIDKYLAHSEAVNGGKHVRMQSSGFERWHYFLGLHGVSTLEGLNAGLASEFIQWRKAGGAAAMPPPEPPPGRSAVRRRAYPVNVGEAAVNRDLAAMKALIAWARDIDESVKPDFDPLRKVTLLAEHHGVNPHRWVAHAEILATFEKLAPRWADLCRVLYGTAFRYESGVRATENASQIDDARSILRDPYTKGKQAVEVKVTPTVLDAAKRCAGHARELAYPKDEAQQLGRRLEAACRAAGVPRWTAHDLRVSAACVMHHEKHVSLRDLQLLLGHADIKTTERYVRAHHQAFVGEAKGPI